MGLQNRAARQLLQRIPPDLLWLVAGITLTVIPHIPRIPVWIPILYLLLAGWRLKLSAGDCHLQSNSEAIAPLVKLLIGAGIFTGIFLSYGTLLGRDAGVSLLILLAGLKLVEIRLERDYYIAGFIGFLLILTNFFYSESIITAAYMSLCIVVIITALIGFNDPDRFLDSGKRIRMAGLIVLQTVPLIIVLFFLFPRINGPLWGLPKDAHSGLSGLDDEMTPGAISKLTLSDEVAFRVEFSGPIPDKSLLYWRGPVLWFTDGVKWIMDKPRQGNFQVTGTGEPVHYTVTLEATDKHWLYGLELPVSPPANSIFSHDFLILNKSAVRERYRYSLSSYTNYRSGIITVDEIKKALQLPPDKHQRSVDLGRSWRTSSRNEREIIAKALGMFNEQKFYYTLTPPPLLDDSIDQFLFDSKQGFCEHYAAAFVILMRAAGIPARVVTGYQGGTVNPIGNYLIVRQRDAHAWSEVWLGKEGWVRVDPTSAVSPARIIEGIENALPDSIIDVPLGLQNNMVVRDIWRRLRNTLDAINNRWNQWVLGYDSERQSLFLHRIGLGTMDWQGLMLWLIITLTCVLFIVAFWLFKQSAATTDHARLMYDKFCAKLSKRGMERQAYEGPVDFARRACRHNNDLTVTINRITRLYIDVRYGGKTEILAQLQNQVKAFNPGRSTAWNLTHR